MIVLKFGGTSIKDAQTIDQCLSIIREKSLSNVLLVVFSASGNTTDILERIAFYIPEGNIHSVNSYFDRIQKHHQTILKDFSLPSRCIDPLLQELSAFVHGLTLLRECTARSKDTLLAFGELLSSHIITERFLQQGHSAHLADSRSLYITNEDFGNAVPLMKQTKQNIKKLPLKEGTPLFLQGFIAANKHGVTTTLGRGGSDYTAAIAAAALPCTHLEIWTDVPGIMTCDPRMIHNAKTVKQISYDEAAELAYFGAKVLHPATIQPAVEQSIPVYIKKTSAPEQEGTCIHTHSPKGIKAIASRNNIYLIQLRSSRMLNTYGFLKEMFSIFALSKISVDLVSTSEVSVTVSTERKPDAGLIHALSQLGKVVVEKDMGIVCIVGLHVWKNPRIVGKIFSSLNPASRIQLITLGASDTNLSVALPEKDIKDVVKRLHDTLF